MATVPGLDAARRATVRVCRADGGHVGQGLLLTLPDGEVVVLTCHHVASPLGPDGVHVALRQADGGFGPPIPAAYDPERSRPERDAAVLRLNEDPDPDRPRPLLHAMEHPEAFADALPAAGIAYHAQADTFGGRIEAGAQWLRVQPRPGGRLPDTPERYTLPFAYRLAGVSDAREGTSGGVVVCANGVLGLAHFARAGAAARDYAAEGYVVPLTAWAEGWPALANRIAPMRLGDPERVYHALLSIGQMASLYESWEPLRPGDPIPDAPILFGRYRAERLAGIGGTALVVSAVDLTLQRDVALKLWDPYIGNPRWWRDQLRRAEAVTWDEQRDGPFFTRDQTQYFLREAQLLAKLDHPNLCKIYDFGVSDDSIPWLALEFLHGTTLRTVINDWRSSRQPHSLAAVLTFAKQILSAVTYLHSTGLYQLDLKPENVLIDGNLLKLIDVASGLERSSKDFRLDRVRCGTPGYVAPEVLSSEADGDVSSRADVFSLGIMLLEMCCLHNPLANDKLRSEIYEALGVIQKDLMVDHTTVAFDYRGFKRQKDLLTAYRSIIDNMDVAQLLAAVPFPVTERLASLIQRSISGDPVNRPRSAGEVLSELLGLAASARQFE